MIDIIISGLTHSGGDGHVDEKWHIDESRADDGADRLWSANVLS